HLVPAAPPDGAVAPLHRGRHPRTRRRSSDMKILAYTSPSRGHLFPLLPILIALRDRGHEVAVRTLAAGVDTARACRFTAAAIDPRIEAIEQDDYRAKTALGSV